MSMYHKDKKHSLNIRFSDSDIDFLNFVANRFNTNLSEVVRQMVSHYRRSYNDKQANIND